MHTFILHGPNDLIEGEDARRRHSRLDEQATPVQEEATEIGAGLCRSIRPRKPCAPAAGAERFVAHGGGFGPFGGVVRFHKTACISF